MKENSPLLLTHFCPACRSVSVKHQCLLKSGAWPESIGADVGVVPTYCSPEKAAAEKNVLVGARVRAGVVVLTGTPTRFRDRSVSRQAINQRGSGGGSQKQQLVDGGLVDGLTLEDYRAFGTTLGVAPSTVELLV